MKVLFVITSHDQLGNTGRKTGFWLEELAAPYYTFKDAGVTVDLASPAGGHPPLDPKSDEPEAQTKATERFKADVEAQNQLAHTLKLSEVVAKNFDALFYPGGHGPLWDLVKDCYSLALVEEMYAAGKPVAAVCHAPAALLHAKESIGHPLIHGKAVTGFSNSEEEAVGLTEAVPFLLQDELTAKGGHYSKADDWKPYVLTDGNLITGQNPASSTAVAKAVIEILHA